MFESVADSPSPSPSRVSSPVLCLSLMKVGSLDHDGERERTVEHRSSTSHGCIYRAREGERVMRMAARKLLQHDGTNMVGGTAPSKSGIFPRALVGLWYFRWEERVIGFTSKESVEFGERHCSTAKKVVSG